MSDFVSNFWHYFIAAATLLSVIGCGVFLWFQTKVQPKKEQAPQLQGHVWDEDLAEYNNPMPNWWRWLFYLTIVFSLGYLAVYPGLGSYAGLFNWSSVNELTEEIQSADAQYGPLFNKYLNTEIVALAKDPQANSLGQRLFLNTCSQCHGSDAGGGKGFPNLRDADWLYGGEPATIEASIVAGRNGVMPALGEAVGGEPGIKEVAEYVRSLSGLKHDAPLAQAGKSTFGICAACHGAEGKGNQAIGAPNLTDEIWLYGSAAEEISLSIRAGRGVNQLTPGVSAMPAFSEKLSPAKIRLLAAYVYSLGGGVAAKQPSASTTASEGTTQLVAKSATPSAAPK